MSDGQAAIKGGASKLTPHFRRRFESACAALGRRGRTFTTPEVLDFMREHGFRLPEELRRVGGLVVSLRNRGIIWPTGQWRKTGSHARPCPVYQYTGAAILPDDRGAF